MNEIVFGSCNHHFTNGKSSKPSHNLLKIYPEENKIDIEYVGGDSEVRITTTIQYGAHPVLSVPQRPPRLKKIKAIQNGEASIRDKLFSQISVDEKTTLCYPFCLPISPKNKKHSDDKKEHNHGEKPP